MLFTIRRVTAIPPHSTRIAVGVSICGTIRSILPNNDSNSKYYYRHHRNLLVLLHSYDLLVFWVLTY